MNVERGESPGLSTPRLSGFNKRRNQQQSLRVESKARESQAERMFPRRGCDPLCQMLWREKIN